MKKRVLLVGGKDNARSLALSLIKQGYHITAVNDTYGDCMKLAEIDNLVVINGDGTNPFVLDDAHAMNCDAAIALTSKDEDNLVICELCKKRFHVKKTISLVSDPKKTDFFYQMGVDSVVCAITAVTSIMEQQAFMEKMENILPQGEGQVQIAEVPIPGTAPVVGKKLWEVNLPREVIIGCILRGGKTMIPHGNTQILTDDVLVLLSGNNQESDAIRELTGR